MRVDPIRKRSLRGGDARLHGGITLVNFVEAHIDSRFSRSVGQSGHSIVKETGGGQSLLSPHDKTPVRPLSLAYLPLAEA